jgi:purine-nucleoside phosphorylase
VEFLGQILPDVPQAAVVLGSGLGRFVEVLAPQLSLAYSEIPEIPRSTAVGHAGQLHFVEILETPTVVLQGRCHRYEGYTRQEVTRLIRSLCSMGLESLIVSCAAGGLNPRFQAGDLMAFDSHLDLLGQNFCAEAEAVVQEPLYLKSILKMAEQVAQEEQVPLRRGTYVAVQGPNYETRAEIRWLQALGGDAVGMSSIPEILAARSHGVQTLGLAMITNECRPDTINPASAHQVLEAAAQGEPRFRKLVLSMLARMSGTEGRGVRVES